MLKVELDSVGWGCRIHRLHVFKGVRPLPTNQCPGYDTKQVEGKTSVNLELWGIWSTPSLPLLPGPLWPGVVAANRVQPMGQIDLKCVLMLN